jgi:phage gpG-like protein
MTPEQFKQHFANLEINFKQAVNRDLPRIAGNEAARLFRINFQKESFFDKKWDEVQRRQTRTVTYTTKKGVTKTRTVKAAKGAAGSRKILTGKTGNLGRSIKVKTETGKAIVYSDVAYSKAHNQGTSNAGRKRNTKIPQRQFIGDNPQLAEALKRKIEQTMNKILKP